MAIPRFKAGDKIIDGRGRVLQIEGFGNPYAAKPMDWYATVDPTTSESSYWKINECDSVAIFDYTDVTNELVKKFLES